MITRIAKGVAPSKTSGTTLQVSSVSVTAGQCLVVGIVYDTGQGAPTVKWGQRTLKQKLGATQAGGGIAVAAFVLHRVKNSASRNVVATWAGAITAKGMVVSVVDGATLVDVMAKQFQAATGSPDTTSATSTAETMSIAFFGSEGPSTDSLGTVGSGHTSGQQTGTTGSPPVSNVSIHETFEYLSSAGTIQATKTGATARDFCSVILAFKAGVSGQGLGESSWVSISEKFESSGKDFDMCAVMFNEDLDRFEAFESTDMNTVICHSANGWA